MDEPVELELNARLIVTILPSQDQERESWLQVSRTGLTYAYGEDEEEYPVELIKEANAEYEGR